MEQISMLESGAAKPNMETGPDTICSPKMKKVSSLQSLQMVSWNCVFIWFYNKPGYFTASVETVFLLHDRPGYLQPAGTIWPMSGPSPAHGMGSISGSALAAGAVGCGATSVEGAGGL